MTNTIYTCFMLEYPYPPISKCLDHTKRNDPEKTQYHGAGTSNDLSSTVRLPAGASWGTSWTRASASAPASTPRPRAWARVRTRTRTRTRTTTSAVIPGKRCNSRSPVPTCSSTPNICAGSVGSTGMGTAFSSGSRRGIRRFGGINTCTHRHGVAPADRRAGDWSRHGTNCGVGCGSWLGRHGPGISWAPWNSGLWWGTSTAAVKDGHCGDDGGEDEEEGLRLHFVFGFFVKD